MAIEKRMEIDESLVKKFSQGDMKAFDIIYSVFNQKLEKFVFTLIKTESDTEEIVQEVFVKTWENRNQLKKYTSFDSYLFTIAYNTTISLIRKRLKESQYIEYVKSVQVEIDDSQFEEGMKKEDIDERLNALIEKMPPRQQEVFKLKHFKNYSYKEIAESLDISVNTVENHVVKAHKFLKEQLGKHYLLFLLFIHLFW